MPIDHVLDNVSFAPTDEIINPSISNNAIMSDAVSMSDASRVEGDTMTPSQDESSDRTSSLQQVNTEAPAKKYYTELQIISGKKYCFCKNVVARQCKDYRPGTQKSQYSITTSGSVLKKHVEVCFGIVFQAEKTLKKDPNQTSLLSKKDHNENLALMLVENMVY